MANEVRRSVTVVLDSTDWQCDGHGVAARDRVPCTLSMSSGESQHPAISTHAIEDL